METEWEPVTSFKPTKLIDGTTADPSTLLMRRRVGEAFEYRRPTGEEEAAYMSRRTW